MLRRCLEPQRVTEKDKKDCSESTVREGEKRGEKKSVDVTVLQRESER